VAEYVVVTTTTENRDDAHALARKLVEDRLAACVQVMGPIESTYRWQSRVEVAAEWLCLIKTTRERYGDLEAAIRAVHPYETPEIVALPILTGSEGYLQWLRDQVAEA
jgi:periplasmic divalent cation tolerance protein